MSRNSPEPSISPHAESRPTGEQRKYWGYQYSTNCSKFIMKKTLLSAALLAFISFAQAQSLATEFPSDSAKNPIVSRAFATMRDVENANVQDIKALQTTLANYMKLPPSHTASGWLKMIFNEAPDLASLISIESQNLIDQALSDEAKIAIALLLAHQELFRSSRECYMRENPNPTHESISFETLSSVNKLAGKPNVPGIFVRAAIMILREYGTNQWLQNLPSPRITVAKTALYYLALAAESLKDPEGANSITLAHETYTLGFPTPMDTWANLSLIYPAPYTFRSSCMKLDETYLTDRFIDRRTRTILVPNAGYVYASELIDGKIKGMDCSLFVSHATHSSVRMTTHLMAHAAINLGAPFSLTEIGKPLTNPDDEKIVDTIMREFELIPHSEHTHIRPGDTIVWRNATSGHTAIFWDWLTPTTCPALMNDNTGCDRPSLPKFIAIHATYNPTEETVTHGPLSLVRPHQQLFVLRRKP